MHICIPAAQRSRSRRSEPTNIAMSNIVSYECPCPVCVPFVLTCHLVLMLAYVLLGVCTRGSSSRSRVHFRGCTAPVPINKLHGLPFTCNNGCEIMRFPLCELHCSSCIPVLRYVTVAMSIHSTWPKPMNNEQHRCDSMT